VFKSQKNLFKKYVKYAIIDNKLFKQREVLTMNKKYQVFVSSTYEDLKDERTAVLSSLLDMDCIPVGMEQFPASSLSQWEYIRKMIDMSDYYLLIVAGRYGSIDPDEGISYTEKEFNYAVYKGIPILSFLHSDIGKLLSEKVDPDRTQINNFRERVKTEKRMVDFYSTIDELKFKVAKAMPKIIADAPATGWVRADKLKSTSDLQDISTKLESLQNDILKKIEESKPKWEFATDDEVKSLFNINDSSILKLSNEAKQLLVETSKDPYGQILISTTLSGTQICTNGKVMNEDENGKSVAIWEDAVMELVNNKLAKAHSSNNDIFKLTKQGYEVAEKYTTLD
jgi:hypothetical protein